MELDKAYKKMQRITGHVKELAEAVKPQFREYMNPFEKVARDLSYGRLEEADGREGRRRGI